MRNTVLITNLLIACLSVIYGQNDLEGAEDSRVVCYYTNWAMYRPDEKWKFNPQKINPYLCTHLIYAFAKVEDDASVAPFDPWQDIDLNGYTEFIDLRETYNENLKCLLAIGGYRAGSTKFTPISASPSRRETLARNALKFLQTHSFDGLNIDWQFPNDQGRDGVVEDYDHFVLLLKDIDKVFTEEAAKSGEPKKLLTISVPGNLLMIQSGYDLSNLHKYTDFINLLSYDYHLAFDPDVGHHSALYPLPEEVNGHANEGLNADATVNYVLSKGVPSYKVNLGIPMFGRSFTLENKDATTLGSPAIGEGEKGMFTREDGYKAYYEICSTIEDGWTVEHPNKTAMGPYAYKGNQWVGYDDEDSVRQKGKYAKQRGLGGLSIWAIDQDDFLGACSKKAFPLIKAAKEGFRKAKGPAPAVASPAQTNTSITTLVQPETNQDLNVGKPMADGAEWASIAGHRSIRPDMKFVTSISTSGTTEKMNQHSPQLPNAYNPMMYVPLVHFSVAYAPVVYFPALYFFPCLNLATWIKKEEDQGDSIEITVGKDEESFVDISTVPSSNNKPGIKEIEGGSGNLILNIYNWGTNYIFSHSPPQNVVGAAQAQLHRPQITKQKTAGAHQLPGDSNQRKWAGEVDIATVLERRQEMAYRTGNPVWS